MRRAVHSVRLTLRQELGIEMAMQHTAKGVLEQAQPLVGDHERLDLGAESPVLAGRHLPQGWPGQVEEGQPVRVRQRLDRGDQPQGFGEVLPLSAGLQPAQLEVPQVRARVQEKSVDEGVSAERLLGGDAEHVGHAVVQRLGATNYFRIDVADPRRRFVGESQDRYRHLRQPR